MNVYAGVYAPEMANNFLRSRLRFRTPVFFLVSIFELGTVLHSETLGNCPKTNLVVTQDAL